MAETAGVEPKIISEKKQSFLDLGSAITIEAFKTRTPSSLIKKTKPKKNNPTSLSQLKLTNEGKKAAVDISQRLLEGCLTEEDIRRRDQEIRTQAQAIRDGLTRSIRSARKSIKNSFYQEQLIKAQPGQKIRKKDLHEQMAETIMEEQIVQSIIIQRRLLSSVFLHVRKAETQAARARIRQTLVEDAIGDNGRKITTVKPEAIPVLEAFAQSLKSEGKKVPSQALLINALTMRILAQERRQKEDESGEKTGSASNESRERENERARELTLRTGEETHGLRRKALERLGSFFKKDGSSFLRNSGNAFRWIKQNRLFPNIYLAAALGLSANFPSFFQAIASAAEKTSLSTVSVNTGTGQNAKDAWITTESAASNIQSSVENEEIPAPKKEEKAETVLKKKVNEATTEYVGIEGARKLKIPTPEEFAKDIKNGKTPKIEHPTILAEFDYLWFWASQSSEVRDKLLDNYADSVLDALTKSYDQNSPLVVFLEPGHRSIPVGGRSTIDTGTGAPLNKGGYVYEKDVNKEMAKRIGQRIVSNNPNWIPVISGDYYTGNMSGDKSDLNSREALGPLAAGWQAVYDSLGEDGKVIRFSLHFNGGADSSRGGDVFYQAVGNGTPKELKLELKSNEVSQNLADSLRVKIRKIIPDYTTKAVSDDPKNPYVTLKGDEKFKDYFEAAKKPVN